MVNHLPTYYAPKPSLTFSERLRLFLFWSFPPSAFLGILSWVVNKIAGSLLGRYIVPVQDDLDVRRSAFVAWMDFLQQVREWEYPPISIAELDVVTHDHAHLNTVEFNPDPLNKRKNQQVHVIYFLGNSMTYEDVLDEMQEDAVLLNANVVGFNPRGVGRSVGVITASRDLVTDGVAQVQRLIDGGVNPEKIFLKGHSLGAGIGTLVAKHFHERKQKINILNGRSFSSLTNIAVGWLRTRGAIGHEDNLTPLRKIANRMLSFLAKPLIKIGLWLTKWEVDVVSAYQAIPDSHKEYMVVRSSKCKREIGVMDDPVITHYGSLHKALKSERVIQKQAIQTAKMLVRQIEDEKDELSKNLKATAREVKLAKMKLQRRKMKNKCVDDPDGHMVSLVYLQDRRTGRSGAQFFRDFVGRAVSHHEIHARSEAILYKKK